MKLIVTFLAITLQVSAAVYSQQITLNFRNARLFEVMQSIKKQSGYDFAIPPENLNLTKPVTINVKSYSIEKTLQIIFADQPAFIYIIENKAILVQVKTPDEKKEKTLSQTRENDLTGTVRDEKGLPLEGATVILKETGKGTTTDLNGQFILRDAPEKGTLIIRMIGRETKKVNYTNSNAPNITLAEIDMTLKEVEILNKGYYTQKLEFNTGNIGKVSGETIRNQPVSNPLTALEGRIPGVYISQNNGVPGSKVNFEIRGKNSIAAGLDPLFVIDGVPFNSASPSQLINAAGYSAISPFNNIRPEDIEDITVLKDADATAIYGSRGANGVVLITTKKGKTGKSRFDFNILQGAGDVANRLNLMNTEQYLEMRNEAYKNDNTKPSATHYDINGAWDKTRYTDWQDVMIGGTSKQTVANGNFSGGSDNTQFLIGGSYRKETTVFPGDFSNTIAGINGNLNHISENKKFSINFSSNFSYNVNDLPQVDFTSLIFMAPNAPVLYTDDGDINWENNTFRNPIANNLKTARVKSKTSISNLTTSYYILPWLQAKINGGFTSSDFSEVNILPYASLMPSTPDPANNRTSTLGASDVISWIIEPQLNFSKSFGRHSLDALIGGTFQENEQNSHTINGRGFASDALLETYGGASIIETTSGYSQYRYNALFARIGYNYAGKYVLNLTGRRDGSSRFGPGKRFGNFGALGAAWILTKEKFIPQNYYLSLLKLRGSIGKTGNDQIPDYNYLETHQPSDGYGGIGGLLPAKLANPNYRWETLNKLEAAIELGFFKNSVLINLAAFRNRTSNQLVGYALPGTTGFDNIIANLPAVIENKGFELDFTSHNIESSKFSWTTTGNLTIPKNKLLAFPGIESTSYATVYAIGQPLDVGYRWKYAGVDLNTGYYTFADLDKDGTIDPIKDRYPVSRTRSIFGGLGNTLAYSGLTLEIFFQFVKQKGTTNIGSGGNNAPGRFLNGGTTSNMPVELLNRWRQAGDQSDYQKFSASGNTTAFTRYSESDVRITDASFVRLKNVTLKWLVPQSWLQSIKVHSANLFIQGQNLLTITSFDGLDPENPYGVSLPPLRMVTAGISVSL